MARVAKISNAAAAMTSLAADHPSFTVWIVQDRWLAGNYPVARFEFDFGLERLTRLDGDEIVSAPAVHFDQVAGRRTGSVFFELLGSRTEFKSWKAAWLGGMRQLEDARPGTLDKLASYRPRSKRPVARQPEDLYDNRKQAQQFSAELKPGWYAATNNSSDEVKRYLKKAAELAGLVWKKDVDVFSL
ncbi:MAG: hypothetical protein GC145_18265 [Caulobacter sp.]|nr:hypothetical protein [Caulobacter sp.]